MAQNRHWEQDKDATIYMGNIDERATPAMMYELMLQMGPIHNIHMPRDRVTQSHQGFGFVEFRTPSDAEYAANVMNGVKLYGKSLRVNKASADRQRATDIGAELFVGNLDPMADEKILYDTFSRFGPLLSLPKVARDDNGGSKGFGFISFGDFESSDAAIENLNNQYLLSSQVTVQYAFKKDGKGERHGDDAERELAAQAKKRNIAPEAQPMPAAFLNGPPAGAAGAPPVGGHSYPPPAASTTPQPPAGFAPPPGMPPGMHMGGPPPPHMGAPPGFAPPGLPQHPRGPSPYNATPGQGPPPGAAGRGGSGSMPPPGSMPLPPAPSGLPARPPQSQAGYTNPADYHPNGGSYRGSGSPAPPPPGFPGAQQQQQQPPPGFGAPGGAPTPPPGFMPPPGFPQQQPPPGYPRR
ncbi:hypothetical protein LMH87_004270 [Akanthomyces muscarius]|uniref:RRM domain-containing protein n=1 Tax=Akanthomyces muscarius TaxID=2231603 RepID=A0A9W8Q2Z6_AKAMU|nr:hypothetical protein LMH87_004270 [Akanthomyces muscarius]KAJ4145418.1 hypothetical protein LMH87_004270 [Akanthomyces muscarius]